MAAQEREWCRNGMGMAQEWNGAGMFPFPNSDFKKDSLIVAQELPRNGTGMIQNGTKWYRNGPGMVQNGTGMVQNGTGMVQEWYRNGIGMVQKMVQKIIQEWSRNGSKNGTGMVHICQPVSGR